MVNIEPHIEVYDVQAVTSQSYGNAGKVALIGAFPTADFKLGLFTRLDDAKESLKGAYRLIDDNSVENANLDPVPSEFVSFYCLDYVFASNKQSKGAESVVIVNTNYGKSNLVQESSNSDIANACLVLAEEDFDILTVAENVKLAKNGALNPICATLKSFVDSQFLAQKPVGIITGFDLTDATATILAEFKQLFKDKGIYKAVVTPVRLIGDAGALNIAQSGCWHSAFTSGRPVNKSETAKIYDDLVGENSKDMFPLGAGITYKNLLDNGFHTTRFRNRRLALIECLSNITPADYDMKIERVKNYIIKRLSLADVLGEDNIRVTRDYLKGLFEYERQLAMSNNYLVDMEYELSAVDSETIQAELKLYIADIVRVVKLNVELNIAKYEGDA